MDGPTRPGRSVGKGASSGAFHASTLILNACLIPCLHTPRSPARETDSFQVQRSSCARQCTQPGILNSDSQKCAHMQAGQSELQNTFETVWSCIVEPWPLCVICVGGIIITVMLQPRRLTNSADCDQAGFESTYAHSKAEHHRARTASHLHSAPRLSEQDHAARSGVNLSSCSVLQQRQYLAGCQGRRCCLVTPAMALGQARLPN